MAASITMFVLKPITHRDTRTPNTARSPPGKKGQVVHRELRGAYIMRGFPPYTYTQCKGTVNQNRTGLECVAGGTARSLPDPQENTSLDHNNSASQVFFSLIILVAYFTSTGHNNVILIHNT